MKIITGVVISYTTIGSIHSDQGAEEIIDCHDVGLKGVTKIEETGEGYTVYFDQGKEIFTNTFEQVTKQEVTDQEYKIRGEGKALKFVSKIYKVADRKRSVHFLLYDEDTGESVAVQEAECIEVPGRPEEAC